jgi:tetratricopeptide (TPR) repeat protein
MPDPIPNPTSEKHAGRTVLVCLFLVLVTAAVYFPVTTHRFVNFDDPDYVTGNAYVQAGLRPESIRWALTGVYSSNWHPLTWMSHMLDCQLYGQKPGGHHLTNVIFHIANTVLLFLLLKGMTSAFWRSAFVAGLFALHPLHVESVAWVAERKDVLSGFFGLLTLLAYAKYVRAKSEIRNSTSFVNHRRQKHYGGQESTTEVRKSETNSKSETRKRMAYYTVALLFFAFGLMSKPMLVTWPFVMLLLDFWPLKRMRSVEGRVDEGARLRPGAWFPLVLEKLPFFALAAGSCIITFVAQKGSGAVVPLSATPLAARIANAIVSYGRYLAKTVWPSKLAVFYPYELLSWDSGEVLGGLVVIAVVTGAALWAWKRKPYFAVGWFWFVGVLVPVIGVVQVGKQAFADRYMYLPHIGLFILLTWGVAELIGRLQWPRWPGFGIGGVVLAIAAIITSHQLPHWRNTRSLFEHALAVTSRNHVALTAIATELVESNKLAEATEDCRLALEYSPQYSEAHNTLAGIYAKQEKFDEAILSYKRALEFDPTYGDPSVGLASVYLKQRKYGEAELHAREALRRLPMHMPSMYCLATALHSEGKLDEAADYYRQLIRLNPGLFSPHRFLGNVLATEGNVDAAIEQYRTAVKIRPDDADTHAVLGLMLMQKNQLDGATEQFLKSNQFQPTNAVANYQLALIYQSRRDFQRAIDYYHKTIQARPDMVEALNNLAWLLAANHDSAVRNGTEAVQLAERACKLNDFKTPVLIGTLAAAYAEAGRFGDAVTTAEKARELALAAGQKETADRNGELIELYRAGRAYHEAE